MSQHSESPSASEFKGISGIKRAFATPSALTMLFLGFGSGLPFLLVGGTLSTWLRDVGMSLSIIGLISYAGFFYVLKFLWAPFVDRFALPFLGRRRGWLLLSQSLLLVALALMAIVDPKSSTFVFVALIALASFAGATQDIVVDAYRIEIAPLEMQGALAATYTLGYRFGIILSGAVALYLADLFGWTVTYLAMAVTLLLPMMAVLLSREPVNTLQRSATHEALIDTLIKPLKAFFQHHGIVVAICLLAFVGLFKFPDQMIGVLAGPFYLDVGFTKSDIATVSKVFGVWAGIAGAFLGGICVASFSIRPILVFAAVIVAISNLAFLLMAQFPGQQWAFFAAITADNVSQGFAGVVLIAFMSSLTQREFTATQYALLVSLANLPGKFVGGISGFIVEASSYQTYFLISAFSVVPTLLVLAFLWRRILPGNDRT